MGKTKAKAPAKRQACKRPKASAATTDLLKIADKVAIQRDIAEAVSRTQEERARAALVDGDPNSPDSQIFMYQAFKEANPKLAATIFGMIDSMAEDAAWEDARINQLSDAIDAWYRANGAADDEHLPKGEGPADFEALRDEFDERFRQLKIAFLRLHGEDGMADLLANDPEDYQAKIEQGKAEIKDVAYWKAELAIAVNTIRKG